MLAKRTVALFFVLTMSFWCTAQSSTNAACTQAERTAAKDLAHSFLVDMREKRSVAPLRSRYLSTKCEPIFSEVFKVEPSVLAEVDCGLVRQYGDASFDSLFLLTEFILASPSDPIDASENMMDTLPAEVAREFDSHPLLHNAMEQELKIKSREELETLVTNLERFSEVARQYINDHPDTAVRSASRLKKIESEVGSNARTECGTSDEPGYAGLLPKGMSLIEATDGMFTMEIIREDRELKIVKIFSISM